MLITRDVRPLGFGDAGLGLLAFASFEKKEEGENFLEIKVVNKYGCVNLFDF